MAALTAVLVDPLLTATVARERLNRSRSTTAEDDHRDEQQGDERPDDPPAAAAARRVAAWADGFEVTAAPVRCRLAAPPTTSAVPGRGDRTQFGGFGRVGTLAVGGVLGGTGAIGGDGGTDLGAAGGTGEGGRRVRRGRLTQVRYRKGGPRQLGPRLSGESRRLRVRPGLAR